MIESVINKGTLIDKIAENMAQHAEVYDKACMDWCKIISHEIETAQALWASGDFTDIECWSDTLPSRPRHHLEDYKRTLDMLAVSEATEVTLSTHDFDRYWNDDWEWKLEFTTRTGGIGMRAESLSLPSL